MCDQRITVDPAKIGGQPCIRGLRIPVATVVAMLADAMAPAEILEALPDLEAEDIDDTLRYAAEVLTTGDSRSAVPREMAASRGRIARHLERYHGALNSILVVRSEELESPTSPISRFGANRDP